MYYLNDLGVLCNLGNGRRAIVEALLTRGRDLPAPANLYRSVRGRLVGDICMELPVLPKLLSRYDCRNNRLAIAALEQLCPAIEVAMARYGAERIGVVMGTSTTGIAETERAVRSLSERGEYPENYHAVQGALGGLGEFVAAYLGVWGPTSTVSTACSSSGNAVLSARRLLALDWCDAVVVGGVDSICDMTLQGFGALEALAGDYCKPFAIDRDGINIGEGAAIFIMSRDAGGARLLGGMATSDAYHISAPHPEGEGAFHAMRGALLDAGICSRDVDYINLHGTGTPHNDSMECAAVARLFAHGTPCSSTKAFTGHTLGAASALELAFCWLLLNCGGQWRLPPSLYLDQRDTQLINLLFTGEDDHQGHHPRVCMSNSFAFGGSNVSLVIGSGDE